MRLTPLTCSEDGASGLVPLDMFIDLDVTDGDQDVIAHIGRGDAAFDTAALYRSSGVARGLVEVALWDNDAEVECGTLYISIRVTRTA